MGWTEYNACCGKKILHARSLHVAFSDRTFFLCAGVVGRLRNHPWLMFGWINHSHISAGLRQILRLSKTYMGDFPEGFKLRARFLKLCYSGTNFRTPADFHPRNLNKARAKRRTSHESNLMQKTKNNRFCSFTLGSTHVKFDVSPGPKAKKIGLTRV